LGQKHHFFYQNPIFLSKTPNLPTKTQACYLFRQLLAGIAFCHDQSVVHRDLKPENIIVGGFWGVFDSKIGVFGAF
jgi:serine/threonine protein kinase